jgi:hypothetical protein
VKNTFLRMLLVLAGAGLAACDGKVVYARADEPSIVFTQPLGQTVPGVPAGPPITVPQGIVTFTFDIPDIPLAGGSTASNQSGFAITTLMRLNQSVLTITPPSTANFDGLDSVTLAVQSGSTTTTIATYTKDPAAQSPITTLVLRGDPNVELLDFTTPGSTGGKQLTVTVSATGTLPTSNWTADVDMDLHLKVTAGWP